MIPAEWLPVLCIAVPLAAGVAILPMEKLPRRVPEVLAVAAAALTLLLSGMLTLQVYGGNLIVHLMAGWKPPVGIVLTVDLFNAFIALIVVFLVFLSALFSASYMHGETGLNYYYSFMMLMLGGMLGVILTGDIFNLFVFMELTGISAYGLTVFRAYRARALEAGFRYLILGAVGTSLLLLGVALLYGAVGTVNYADLAVRLSKGIFLPGVDGSLVIPLSIMLIVTGLGVKASFFPLHTVHLDATSEAPSPVAAILSGAETKVGIYAICRLIFLIVPFEALNWPLIFAVLSLFTMTFGNVAALLQEDLKRMLAYSSIAHIGYILMGVAAGSQLGVSAALLHIFNHSVMKGVCFLCAGIFMSQVGTRSLSQLSGVGRRLPVTTTLLSIAFLSLIGVPPLSGFVSKFLLFTASLTAGMLWLVLAAIINTVLSTGYYLRFLKVLIRPSTSLPREDVKEASPLLLASPFILTVLLVVFGLWPQPLLEVSNQAASTLFQLSKYVSTVLGGS
ncbi:hypothetical protein DRO53_03185 [Candidatus Bathyarchaeota archaeon]|nr:MAG: hypothetical protein DRO53_03185 [Candidatus Bathyarchaeota archaeon]